MWKGIAIVNGLSLSNPHAMYWLLLAVPIVLLYARRTPSPRQAVATAWLWQQVLPPNDRRRRWREPVSLAVQVVILALLVVALANPGGQEVAGSQPSSPAPLPSGAGRRLVGRGENTCDTLPVLIASQVRNASQSRLSLRESRAAFAERKATLGDVHAGVAGIANLRCYSEVAASDGPDGSSIATVLEVFAIGLLAVEWCLYQRCWVT